MKKVLSVLCVLVLVVMLTACGKKTMVGTYKLIEMEANGEKADAKMLETLGIKMELVVNDDKTAVLKMDGEQDEKLTYNDKEFIGKDEETGEDMSISYTLDGKKLTLSKDGEKMVFEK